MSADPSTLPNLLSYPYPSQRMPLLARNVVSTSQPLAASAGLLMLARGGNAVVLNATKIVAWLVRR